MMISSLPLAFSTIIIIFNAFDGRTIDKGKTRIIHQPSFIHLPINIGTVIIGIKAQIS